MTKPTSLHGILDIPQIKMIPCSHHETPVVSARCKYFRNHLSKKSPEVEAARFYALNQLVAVISANYAPKERLPEELQRVVETYSIELARQGTRMFTYMMLITTRESRHASISDSDWWKKVKEPAKMKKFWSSIKGNGSDGAVDKFFSDPPAMSLGSYTEALVKIFAEAGFSKGYGGMPWANIASCLNQFVQGNTSLEIMVDTAYTLAHNNGPMFNKGMLYHMYSDTIYRVLDIQRSGQVVEAILNTELKVDTDSELYLMCEAVRSKFPEAIGECVDWIKVKELGAVKSYTDEINKYQKKVNVAKAKAKAVASGFKPDSQVKVFPSLSLTTLKRVA